VSQPHWLLHRGTPERRRLDGETIVEQAHALLHEGGSAALSMRTLAAALGTSTSALYRHVPSKPWLLVAIVDLVLAEVDTAPTYDPAEPARSRLESLSMSYRRALAAHPHLHEVLTSQVALTPNSMRIAEAALFCLREHGIGDDELTDAYNAWCGYVIGFSILETKARNVAPDPALQNAMRAQLEQADLDGFPILRELMAELADRAYGLRWQGDMLGSGDASFGWGLRALLDSYERRGGAQKRRTKGTAE